MISRVLGIFIAATPFFFLYLFRSSRSKVSRETLGRVDVSPLPRHVGWKNLQLRKLHDWPEKYTRSRLRAKRVFLRYVALHVAEIGGTCFDLPTIFVPVALASALVQLAFFKDRRPTERTSDNDDVVVQEYGVRRIAALRIRRRIRSVSFSLRFGAPLNVNVHASDVDRIKGTRT